jgi:hypothetical protein
MKKLSAYVWAFIVLIVVFFTAGVATLGSAATSGKSMFIHAGEKAYFSLVNSNGDSNSEKVKDVYVKIGSVYNAMGEDFTVNVAFSTSQTPSATSSFTKATNVVVNNVYSEKDGLDGVHYNWLKVVSNWDKEAKTISFSSTANLDLYEIVCVNENGERLGIKAYDNMLNPYTAKETSYACDAQESVIISENAYYNLTMEEGYYLASAQTLLGGRSFVSGCQYLLDENFNYLGTILISGSVAIFGASAFAVRLPAFMATCALILFAFLLMRALFKSDKLAFIGGILLCVGGMATTVGRLGAPYAFVASALVASVYFMHRFFAKGILNKHIVKDGANILCSGLFAAVAMSIDGGAIFPAAAILVLFGFGMRRQKQAYQVALAKTNGLEETTVTASGETKTVNKEADRITAQYKEKNRISYGFATLSFIMGTIVLTFISAILSYSAFIKVNANTDLGFARLLWTGFKNSLLGNGVLPFAVQNASNAFAWFLPWKANTVYTGLNGGSAYLAWSVTTNVVVTSLSLIALIFVTVKVALGFVKKAEDKHSLRIRRAYFVLLGGLATGMLMAACRMHVSILNGYVFQVCYVAFLPLAATAIVGEEKGTKNTAVDIALWVIVGLAVAAFVLTVPAAYGIAVSSKYAKAFAWTTFASNGLFR